MIGPRITTVFRSRWNALFWSAGILATAYCSVPDESGQRGTQRIVKAAASLKDGQQDTSKPKNPWALPDAKPVD
jgi:hypothetical protein